MKIRIIAVLVAVLFVISVVSAFAVVPVKSGKIPASVSKAQMKCANCGKAITNPAKAVTAVCNGKKCTFCSTNCKQMCMKNGKCQIMNNKSAKKGTAMGANCANGVCKMPAATSKKAGIQSAICPIMGTKIPDISKAYAKETYKGKTYYFCCGMCKPMFDKNPGKYIKK